MDVLLSFVSAWSEVPLVNEDGGSLLVGLELGLVGVALTVLGETWSERKMGQI